MPFNSLPKLLTILENQPSWHNFYQYRTLRESWLNLVGEKAFENSRPLYINRNVLFCAASNSVWAQNLTLQKYTLTQKINHTLSLNLTDLRFTPAQWYYRSLHPPSETPPLTSHPSYITPLNSISSPLPQNCHNSAQKWLETLKKRQLELPLCPQCQIPSPPGELARWGVCMYCFSRKQV